MNADDFKLGLVAVVIVVIFILALFDTDAKAYSRGYATGIVQCNCSGADGNYQSCMGFVAVQNSIIGCFAEKYGLWNDSCVGGVGYVP